MLACKFLCIWIISYRTSLPIFRSARAHCILNPVRKNALLPGRIVRDLLSPKMYFMLERLHFLHNIRAPHTLREFFEAIGVISEDCFSKFSFHHWAPRIRVENIPQYLSRNCSLENHIKEYQRLGFFTMDDNIRYFLLDLCCEKANKNWAQS